MKSKNKIDVAYFSMEFGFSGRVPNYAGGLGILAADIIFSAADLGKKVVGISLIYHKSDDPTQAFPINNFLKKTDHYVWVKIEDRDVKLAIWKVEIPGVKGTVPIYFLSSYLLENQPWDRDLTKNLYSSDGYTRFCQEVILGVGGVRALEELGYQVDKYHLNEGHCSFLTLELLKKKNYDENEVKKICSFTTHTPVASGHDQFGYDLAYRVANDILPWNIRELAGQDNLSMTKLALSLSGKSNGVSQRHGEVCRQMFPEYEIDSITNGIYHPRWIGAHMELLFNKHLKGWRQNPEILARATEVLPDRELLEARALEKRDFIEWVNRNSNFFPLMDVNAKDCLKENVLTVGFARRFVPYKRPDMIFSDLQKLKKIAGKKLQLVFAGNCNPTDDFCHDVMRTIGRYAQELRGEIRVALIPYYDIEIAKKLVKGVDVWMNTPIPPKEASGTSGMKTSLNGCLNLSILDGWWIEGYQKYPLSGWAFGGETNVENQQDEKALVEKMEDVIDCYYNHQEQWVERMKNAIALASFFNTHRVVKEYFEKMW